MIIDCPGCKKRHVILDRALETMARCECGQEFALTTSAFETGVIKCGNCGANPPSDREHCPYCDARLVKIRCPRCVACAIEGDQHCRACGHQLDLAVRQPKRRPDQVLDCPRCQHDLKAVMAGDALIDECAHCGGIWVGHEVFKDVIAEKYKEGILSSLRALVPSTINYGRGAPETPERYYVPCPHCQELMHRRQFASVSKVVVDVCKEHGIWFDYDELPRIVEFVSSGGLGRAMDMLHQKRVAELKAANRTPAQVLREQGERAGTLDAVDVIAAIVAFLS